MRRLNGQSKNDQILFEQHENQSQFDFKSLFMESFPSSNKRYLTVPQLIVVPNAQNVRQEDVDGEATNKSVCLDYTVITD